MKALPGKFSAPSAAIAQFLDVVSLPSASFARITEGSVKVTWLVAALSMFFVLFEGAALLHNSAALSTAEMGVGSNLSRVVNIIVVLSIATIPVILLLRIISCAFLLWIGTMLTDLGVNFKQLMSLCASIEIITALHEVTLATLKLALHLSPISHADVGLNLLIPAHGILESLLGLFNPFTIWYVALTVLGLKWIGRSTTSRAVLSALPLLIASVVFTVGMATLTKAHL